MGDFSKDKRFASVMTDPMFRNVPKKVQKTKIDKRFQAMFDDKEFKLKYSMDKRGRPVNTTSTEDLKRFYDISSGSDDEGSDVEVEKDSDPSLNQKVDAKMSAKKINDPKVKKENSPKVKDANMKDSMFMEEPEKDSDDVSKSSEADELSDVVENAKKEEFDRTSDLSTSDSDEEVDESSDSDDDDDIPDGEFDHNWAELAADAPAAEETTKRLAVCNMDWDRIRAEDILAVFNSFKPADSTIHSVKIYPSEYGLKRMEDEKVNGPAELVEEKLGSDDESKDPSKEGSKYHREKLRQYQLNRLKYYFAVVECDTPETADSLYEQLNGMEYESSAVSMDIRFIPDDVTFDQDPTSIVTDVPNSTEYRPRLFCNTALQQVKVNLTWDETDPRRRDTLRKAFTEPESVEKDIREYLASCSESEDEPDLLDSYDDDDETGPQLNEEDRIAKYKSLILSLEEKKKEEDEEKYDMEVVWEPGLKEEAQKMVNEKMIKANLTPFEEKLKKRKEDKKLKKKDKITEQKSKLSGSDEDQNVFEQQLEECSDVDVEEAFASSKAVKSRKKKQRKLPEKEEEDNRMAEELALFVSKPSKAKPDSEKELRKKKKNKEIDEKQDDFEVDVNDTRFSAVYTSHLFHIDPSDPHYKGTKGLQAFVNEKQKKRKAYDRGSDSEENESNYAKDKARSTNYLSKTKLKHRKRN